METRRLTGTDFVVSFSSEPIDGLTLSEMDFKVAFYTTSRPRIIEGELVGNSRCLVYSKEECVMVDENTYIALLRTGVTGAGDVKLRVFAKFLDSNWRDITRQEYAEVETDIVTEL